jgi:hypothetical protein
MTNINEIWADIPGYDDLLQASNKQRIRVKPRYVDGICADGITSHTRLKKGIILKQHSLTGYRAIRIKIGDKRYRVKVHILVAKAFIPNPFNLPEINHKDGDKWNSSIENLEWCTRKFNHRHAVKTGLIKIRRFTDEQILDIREMAKTKTRVSIAKIFNVRSQSIDAIVNNTAYQF